MKQRAFFLLIFHFSFENINQKKTPLMNGLIKGVYQEIKRRMENLYIITCDELIGYFVMVLAY